MGPDRQPQQLAPAGAGRRGHRARRPASAIAPGPARTAKTTAPAAPRRPPVAPAGRRRRPAPRPAGPARSLRHHVAERQSQRHRRAVTSAAGGATDVTKASNRPERRGSTPRVAHAAMADCTAPVDRGGATARRGAVAVRAASPRCRPGRGSRLRATSRAPGRRDRRAMPGPGGGRSTGRPRRGPARPSAPWPGRRRGRERRDRSTVDVTRAHAVPRGRVSRAMPSGPDGDAPEHDDLLQQPHAAEEHHAGEAEDPRGRGRRVGRAHTGGLPSRHEAVQRASSTTAWAGAGRRRGSPDPKSWRRPEHHDQRGGQPHHPPRRRGRALGGPRRRSVDAGRCRRPPAQPTPSSMARTFVEAMRTTEVGGLQAMGHGAADIGVEPGAAVQLEPPHRRCRRGGGGPAPPPGRPAGPGGGRSSIARRGPPPRRGRGGRATDAR